MWDTVAILTPFLFSFELVLVKMDSSQNSTKAECIIYPSRKGLDILHLNPAPGKLKAGVRRGGQEPPGLRQPIRAGGSLPSPSDILAPKFQTGLRAAARRLPPPSSANRNYVRKISQRSPATARSGPRHRACGLSSSSPEVVRSADGLGSIGPAVVGWRRGRDRRRRDSGRAR